jgi:ribosomal protein L19E
MRVCVRARDILLRAASKTRCSIASHSRRARSRRTKLREKKISFPRVADLKSARDTRKTIFAMKFRALRLCDELKNESVNSSTQDNEQRGIYIRAQTETFNHLS